MRAYALRIENVCQVFYIYYSVIKTKAGAFTNLLNQQGGFHESGMRPLEATKRFASPLNAGGTCHVSL
jgi:hypothetical protein